MPSHAKGSNSIRYFWRISISIFAIRQNQDQTKRLFYVMVARAKEQVIMLKEAGKHCPVDAILPQDTEILERK
jgi:ferredoxin